MGNNTCIIGITGGFGSGKSTAADFLKSKGFKKITLSSFLEKEARKRKQKITRKILQDIGNQWRTIFGKDILANEALDYIAKHSIKKAVIDGIRNTGEVKRLKKEKNFTLLAITVNPKERFERLKNLKRREKLSWDLFLKLDKRDQSEKKETGLQVAACQKLADDVVENNGTIMEFKTKLGKFFKSIL